MCPAREASRAPSTNYLLKISTVLVPGAKMLTVSRETVVKEACLHQFAALGACRRFKPIAADERSNCHSINKSDFQDRHPTGSLPLFGSEDSDTLREESSLVLVCSLVVILPLEAWNTPSAATSRPDGPPVEAIASRFCVVTCIREG